MNDNVILMQQKLGEPKRYAYRAQPVVLYIRDTNGVMTKVTYYSVDFEIACDLKNLSDARGKDCVAEPHLINIREPEGQSDYVSHCVIVDEVTYERLLSFTNTDGRLRRYTGVVDGYSMKDVYGDFGFRIPDTGLCLAEHVINTGGLKRPVQPFDEKKHMRYIQASESHKLKLSKEFRKKR